MKSLGSVPQIYVIEEENQFLQVTLRPPYMHHGLQDKHTHTHMWALTYTHERAYTHVHTHTLIDK